LFNNKTIYELKGKKKIFDEDFVLKMLNNKINYKMIINNKVCEITDEYEIFDDNMKFLKVRLIILNKEKINFSGMFYECDSLIYFELSSKEDIKLKNNSKIQKRNKNINSKNKNHRFESDNKLGYLYETIIEDDSFYQTLNEPNLENLYNNTIENNDISNEIEEMKIINSSNNFTSSSFKSTELKNNNNDFFSITKSQFSSTIYKIIKKNLIIVRIKLK